MSALARPALGLLPSNARYVLARDESVRLELIAGSVDASTLQQARELFDAEKPAWEGESLDVEQTSALIQQLDEDQLSNAQSIIQRKSALESFSRSLAPDTELARAFTVDEIAPWGLFRLADDEIITVEANPDQGVVWLDRVLDVPAENAVTFAATIEWLLRINSVSVIGPRCAIQFEPENNIALLGACLAIDGLLPSVIRETLNELDGTGRRIEAQWRAIDPVQVSEHPGAAAPASGWLRG